MGLSPSKPAGRDLRIVLIGKSGEGKSAAGNTILGQDLFTSLILPSSVTESCSKERVHDTSKRWLNVVDTPGVLETKKETPKCIYKEILKCLELSSPGPHVFLLVVKLGPWHPEDQTSVEAVEKLFGPEVFKHVIVLFTHGDKLRGQTIQNFVDAGHKDLKKMILRCSGRYHVFDNTRKNRHQVDELVNMIDKLVAAQRYYDHHHKE